MAVEDPKSLGQLVQAGEVSLGRGNIISALDIAAHPGDYPIYSSAAKSNGEFGRYGRYMFDEAAITWSIDGGGRPFYRHPHRYSVTNVCGYLRILDSAKWDYQYLHASMEWQHRRLTFDYQLKAHPSVIQDLYEFDPLPLPEQRRIATILDTLDEAIRRTEEVIEKLKQMKQGLLHDLLTRGIDDNGELRPAPDEAPHLYKDSPLGRIPRGWGLERLGALSRGGISNGVFKEPARVGSGAPLINVLDLYQGFGVDLAACERFAATSPELARFGVRTGDIFFTRSSLNLQGIAHCNVLRGDAGDSVYECHLMRVRPDDGRSDSAFLTLWCQSPFARSFFMSRAKQTTMTTISQPDIYPLPVPMPSVSEQKGVVERLDGLLRRESDEKQSLAKLAEAKRGLMDDLLTGRVRTNPAIELAQAVPEAPSA